jgi:hypothetical protein
MDVEETQEYGLTISTIVLLVINKDSSPCRGVSGLSLSGYSPISLLKEEIP